MSQSISGINSPELKTFYECNPDVNINGIDLNSSENLANLNWKDLNQAVLLPQLKALQRLLRLGIPQTALTKMFEKGIHSAFQIADMNKHDFVDDYKDLFDSPEESEKVYQVALAKREQAVLFYAALKDHSGSHYRAGRFNNLAEATDEVYGDIPDYEDFFGPQDYCECPECRNIYSPAAYLTDLIRLKNKFIDEGKVPSDYKFVARRNDIEEIKLSFENTTAPVPYLDRVIDVVVDRLQRINNGDRDVMKDLSTACYPFNMPFHLPLTQLRTYFSCFKTDLSQIYQVLNVKPKQEIVAQEELQLSFEEKMNLILPLKSLDQLNKFYNVDDITEKNVGEICRKDVFVKKVGCSYDDLFLLLNNDLAIEEKNAGNGKGFFINCQKDGTPGDTYLTIPEDKRSILSFTNGTQITVENYDNIDYLKNTYAVGVWIYPENINDEQDIAVKGDLAGEFSLRLFVQNGKVGFQYFNTTDKEMYSCSTKESVLEEKWQHVGVVKKPDGTIGIYINSIPVEIESTGKPGSPKENTNKLFIAPKPAGDTKVQYSGALINFGIWNNTELEQTAFTLIMYSTPTPDLEKLRVGYWTLDEGEGIEAKNAVEVGKPGVITLPNWKKDQFIPLHWLIVNCHVSEEGTSSYYEPMNLENLDRINRFIRLQRKTGWSSKQLNLVLTSSCTSLMNESTLVNCNIIRTLFVLQKPELDVLCSFWSHMEVIGMKQVDTPQDLFDQVFNSHNTVEPPKTNPLKNPGKYQPKNKYNNLFEDDVETWTIKCKSDDPKTTWKEWLLAALNLSEENLMAIINFFWPEKEGEQQVALDLTNLSIMYRISKLAIMLGLSMKEFVLLYQMAGSNSDPDSIAFVEEMIKLSAMLKNYRLHAAQLNYMVHGVLDESISGYTKAQAINMLNNLFTSSQKYLIPPQAFVTDLISRDVSEQLFDMLKTFGNIDKNGVLLNWDPYLSFNGSNTQVTIPNYQGIQEDLTSGLTVGLWLYPKVCANIVFSKNKVTEQEEHPFFHLAFNDKEELEFKCAYLHNEKKTTEAITVTTPKINPGYWKQLSIRINILEENVGEVVFYINGVEVAKETAPHFEKLCVNKNELILGTKFSGYIANYGIWKKPLTSTDIRAIMQDDKVAWDQCVGYWPMIESQGTEAHDIAGTEEDKKTIYHSGTIENGSWCNQTSENSPGTVRSVVDKYAQLQLQMVLESIASLNNGAPIVKVDPILTYVEKNQDIACALQMLLEPTISKDKPLDDSWVFDPKIKALLDAMQRYLFLFMKTGQSEREIETVLTSSTYFNIADFSKLDVDAIQSLYTYESLQSSFNDTQDLLVTTFFPADEASCLSILASITLWDEHEIVDCNRVLSVQESNFSIQTVFGLFKMQQCFDLSRKLGLKMMTLFDLQNKLWGDRENPTYEDYSTIAEQCYGVLKAKYSDEEWLSTKTHIEKILNPAKRDALIPYAMVKLTESSALLAEGIQTTRDLYEYLLIDVEMGGETTTSKIKEAISAIQLYVHRCRINMEPAVVLDPQLDQWWEWIGNYRVWEANRKVFLYPENYLKPELRIDKTPLFGLLENDLLQTDITDSSVATALRKYLDGLTEVGRLKISGSYVCSESNGDKRLYLIGRTTEAPFRFHFRTLTFTFDNNSKVFIPKANTDWEKIELDISAKDVAPVFVFGKLFIFWTEQQSRNITSISPGGLSNAQVSNTQSTETTICYSYYDCNLNWVAIQYLEKQILSTVRKVYPLAYQKEANDKEMLLLLYGDKETTNDLWMPKQLYLLDEYFKVLKVHTCIKDNKKSICAATSILGSANNNLFIGKSRHCLKENCFGIPTLSKEGLLSLYLFNGNSKNECNSYFNGVSYGAASVKGRPESLNNAYSFVNDAYMDIPDMTTLEGDITLSTWIYITENETYRILVNKHIRHWTPEIMLSVEGRARLEVAAEVQDKDETAYRGIVLFTDDNIPVKQWVNITATVSSADKRLVLSLYVNGKISKTEEAAIIRRRYDTNSVRIGNPYKNWCDKHPVYLSEVYIYNRVLSDQEIANTNSDYLVAKDSKQTVSEINLASSVVPVTNMPGWNIIDTSEGMFLNTPKFQTKTITDVMSLSADFETIEVVDDLFPDDISTLDFSYHRLNTTAVSELTSRIAIGDVRSLLALSSQELPESPLSTKTPFLTNNKIDFNGVLGKYYWELFFHIPILIANQLMANQKYKEARKWYQYVFDPTCQEQDTKPEEPENDRYWRFLGLRFLNAASLEEILSNPDQLAAYRNDPFDPHAIARLRPIAYQKNVIMSYIDNLMAWGDQLFKLDSIESNNEALMLYILAYDLLGNQPISLGQMDLPPAEDYKGLEKKYSIEDFLIQLENKLNVPVTLGVADTPNNYIPGVYYGVPENNQFLEYWNVVEDRLYKLRNSMDINGNKRVQSLFQPPLDPAQLVKAIASGVPVGSVMMDMMATVPNYRFNVILEKARSMTSTVMQLGSSFLSALEKKDGEALQLLRNSQEQSILNMTKSIKEKQLEVAEENIESLIAGQANAKARLDYYSGLIDQGLSTWEEQQIAMNVLSNVFGISSQVMQMAASIAYMVPQLGSPFAITFGGKQLGSAASSSASVMQLMSSVFSFQSSMSSIIGGFVRRADDWKLQETLAGNDINQIDKQIESAQLQKIIAEKEIDVLEKNIENNDEIETFLKTKFTNTELYQWMAGRLSELYFQSYQLAMNLSLSAQKAFQFERGSDESFINPGHWDSLKSGLLAGEGLMLDLQRMEKAYADQNTRRMELQKTISLLKINDGQPLVDLRTSKNHECFFNLDEDLFDFDFPGQYCRQIKSVTVTFPALVGPYQNINAVLTQLSNKTILQPKFEAVQYLNGTAEKEPDASVLRSDWRSRQQVSLTRGVNDSGMFEMNFHDDRYLPFEGTGAVSQWHLQLTGLTNQIDLESLTDVIITLNYTAEMDAALAAQVKGELQDKEYQAWRLFNMAHDFPDTWNQFKKSHSEKGELTFTITSKMMPMQIAGSKITGAYIKGLGDHVNKASLNINGIDLGDLTDGSVKTFPSVDNGNDEKCDLSIQLDQVPEDPADIAFGLVYKGKLKN